MNRNTLIIVLGAIIQSIYLIGCETDGPSKPIDPGQAAIPYRAEAEQAALYYSGEFRPPEDLTRSIGTELDLIRKIWGDSLPDILNARFVLPWDHGSLIMSADDTTFESIASGTNQRWDSLNTHLGTQYSTQVTELSPFIWVSSQELLHPYHLGPFFVEFPGLRAIGSGAMGYPMPSFWIREEIGSVIKYYFALSVDGTFPRTNLYFLVRGGSVDLRAVSIDIHPDLPKPAWLDTAYACYRILEDTPPYSWRRSE